VAKVGPDIILNYGCAGAHRRDIMPGDVIIGAQTVNHAALNILPDGTEIHNDRGNENSGERIFPAVIDADPDLLARATRVSRTVEFTPWPAGVVWPASIPHRAPQVHVGPLASSEIWTQNLDRLDVLHARHQTLSEDNESGAFAHVAYIHDIPFLSIKDIANNEYHASSDLAEFSDFPTAEVGKRAAQLVAALIEEL
jgi:nucleoside phosphorylase